MAQVLIVGGGPVGLAVGGELLRRGVSVRIVDRGRPGGNASKAILVWPRTLELLGGLGVADRMTREGHLLDGVRFYSQGSGIGTVRLTRLPDSRFNHLLMLPQWRTERILLDRFTELGGSVDWDVELTGLSDEGDGCRVELTHADGRREQVRTPWLVAADGAHSTVRKKLGVRWDVYSPNMVFAIGDAPVRGDLDPSLLHYFYSRHGSVGVGPLGEGVFRFAVSIREDQQPTKEVFQDMVDRCGGRGARVGEPTWATRFTVRCATAGGFRHGRVFLAGDAAHVISPASGQGLNTGFHDAVNLSWKLAGVVLGTLDETVLNSYDTERRAAVERIAALTAKQTRWGLLSGRWPVATRDAAVRVASLTGAFQRLLAPVFSQTDVSYQPAAGMVRSLAWRYPSVRVGQRLPYIGDTVGSGDTTLPMLVVSPGRTPDRAALDRLIACAPVPLPVLELPADVRTPGGMLARLLGPRAAAVLVRPDGHLLTGPERIDDPAKVFAPLRSLVRG